MRNWKITVLFTVIIVLTFSSIVLSGLWKDSSTIKRVELSGNTALSGDEIFDFAKLSDSLICSNAYTLEMIESRISKHPNIKKVVVSRDAGVVKIEISEKNPFAIASNGSEMFLVDDQLSLYNMKKEQVNLDLPVISGLSAELGVSTFGKNDMKNLKIAQYIIGQAVSLNKSLYNYISEVNFSDSNCITIITNDDATRILFVEYSSLMNRISYEPVNIIRDINNAALRETINSKLIHLNAFLKQVRVYKPANSFKYIDMRYNDLIVVKYNIQQSAQ